MKDEHIFDLLHQTIKFGDNLGAQFVEARYDDLTLTTINYTNEKVKESSTKQRRGIGVNVYFNGSPGYSFTSSLSDEAIKEATKRAFGIAKAAEPLLKFKHKYDDIPAVEEKLEHQVKIHPREVEFDEKLDMLKRGVASIKEQLQPHSTTALWGELWGSKLFVNSEGTEIYWTPILVDMRIIAIAKGENSQARGMDGVGQSQGMELFKQESSSPETIGSNAGKYCKEQLEAIPAPAGKQKALVGPRMAGVLAHESFGHLSESDFVITGMSPIADRVGEQLGSEYATIIDEGISEYGGFYLPYDDQGTKTGKTILMDKGTLVGYLHDRSTANKMNTKPTGNSRAITFMFPPIPRMKNTYIQPQDLSFEEAAEQVKDGIYAAGTSGGQANLDGTFLFKCSRGYMIEKGEITKPIKDAALSGQILDFIKQISGVGKEMELFTSYFGGCGKAGQYPLPVGLGGPHLVVDEVLVGGE
ncbi:MAG: TldD/PmbA family protein [Candidatus Heimdallarchaeaceae archaeon]